MKYNFYNLQRDVKYLKALSKNPKISKSISWKLSQEARKLEEKYIFMKILSAKLK